MTSTFHIVIAMKPCEGTFAENALKHGVAGLAIDACRIGTNPNVDDSRLGGKGKWGTRNMAKNAYGDYAEVEHNSHILGRFPANVIHDASAEVLAGFPQTKSGSGNKNTGNRNNGKTIGNGLGNGNGIGGDSGSAARFFHTVEEYEKENL